MYKQLVKLRSGILVFLTHNMALPMLKLFRKNELFPYTATQLQHFPAGTLGKDLAGFLDVNNLQLLPYYARHDIKHILLGYETTDEGEGCLQCFMLGNGHISFPVVATVVYCFTTMPEHWHSFGRAFPAWPQGNKISGWKWFDILPKRTITLKLKIDQPQLV